MKRKIFISLAIVLLFISGGLLYSKNKSNPDMEMLLTLYQGDVRGFTDQWQFLDDEHKEKFLPEATDIMVFLFDEAIDLENIKMMDDLEELRHYLLKKREETWQQKLLKSIQNYRDFLEFSMVSDCNEYNREELNRLNKMLGDSLAFDLTMYYNTSDDYYWYKYLDVMDYVYYYHDFKECDDLYLYYIDPYIELHRLYNMAYIESSDFSGTELKTLIQVFIDYNDAKIEELKQKSETLEEMSEEALETVRVLDRRKDYIDEVSNKYKRMLNK